jgi:hypothetical protein
VSGISELDLRDLVRSGASFAQILERARETEGFSAVSFLHAVQVRLGISFVETRNMFEYFDKDWSPLADQDAIESRWRSILKAHGY